MEGLSNFLTVKRGNGSGSGYGYGNGYGSGSGYGNGSGDGNGYGYGSGSGLLSFAGKSVYYIDDLPTVVTQLKGVIAKGFIINQDLTTSDCFVVRVGNSFAHGETLKKAQRDAEAKHLNNIPVEDKVSEFLTRFKDVKLIPAKDLFEWHFILTGSCEMGRRNFCEQNEIDLEATSMTIESYIELTEDSYGSEVIKLLKDENNSKT